MSKSLHYPVVPQSKDSNIENILLIRENKEIFSYFSSQTPWRVHRILSAWCACLFFERVFRPGQSSLKIVWATDYGPRAAPQDNF